VRRPLCCDHAEEFAMRGLRRAVMAVLLGALVGAVLRLLGADVTPPDRGGWRELSGPDLR
jgi:hypothetical protein